MAAVNCGTYPPFFKKGGCLQPLKRFSGVYLVNSPGSEKTAESRHWVLKHLKIGAVRAALIGKMLLSNEKSVPMKGDSENQGVLDPPPCCCPVLPRFIKPPEGANYWWFRGNRYFITELIRGREADYHQDGDLQAAIRAMKAFHQFTQNLIAEAPYRWLFLKFDAKKEWRKRIREMEICRDIAIQIRDGWSREYLKNWRQFYDQAWQAYSRLGNGTGGFANSSTSVKDVICYHDWAYHNVIIQEDGVRLIDFDYMIADRAVHDKVNLIGRYLRLNRWSTESLFKILWNFDRFYEWKSGELRWLLNFLTFPYDYWILGRQYFIEKQHWSAKYYQDQWERKISCETERNRALRLIEQLDYYSSG